MNNKSGDDRYPNYENLLDDLYSLQKNLLPESNSLSEQSSQLPPTVGEEDMHNLEVPILSEVVDSEIHQEQQVKETFNSAQQHLFDQPSSPQPVTAEQINAVVAKLMTRLRPKIDQILRDKIRTMVAERFNRKN